MLEGNGFRTRGGKQGFAAYTAVIDDMVMWRHTNQFFLKKTWIHFIY